MSAARPGVQRRAAQAPRDVGQSRLGNGGQRLRARILVPAAMSAISGRKKVASHRLRASSACRDGRKRHHRPAWAAAPHPRCWTSLRGPRQITSAGRHFGRAGPAKW